MRVEFRRIPLGDLKIWNNNRWGSVGGSQKKPIISKEEKRVQDDIDKAVLALKRSMATTGLLQPIVVRQFTSNGKVELIIECGTHRFRAAELLGWEDIPCMVIIEDEGVTKEDRKVELVRDSAVENTVRKDPFLAEIGLAAKILVEDGGYSIREVAGCLNRSVKLITDALKIINSNNPTLINKVKIENKNKTKDEKQEDDGVPYTIFLHYTTICNQARPAFTDEEKKLLWDLICKYHYGTSKMTHLIDLIIKQGKSLEEALQFLEDDIVRYVRVLAIPLPVWWIEEHKNYPGGITGALKAVLYGILPPIPGMEAYLNSTGT